MIVNYSLDSLALIFKSSCTLVMVWKVFSRFDKNLVAFMHFNR